MSLILFFCVMLVSEVPMFSLKFKNIRWKGNEDRFVLLIMAIVCVVLLGMASVATPAWSEIFRCVDSDGKVTYSNVGGNKGCKRMQLEAPNSVAPPPARATGRTHSDHLDSTTARAKAQSSVRSGSRPVRPARRRTVPRRFQ